MIKKTLATALVAASCLSAIGQIAHDPTDHLHVPYREFTQVCGISQEYILRTNNAAHGIIEEGSDDDDVQSGSGTWYTSPCNFAPNGIFTNMNGTGKFRVYFEDINTGTGEGFNAPGTLGTDRINTLLAVLDYIETTIDIPINTQNDHIELYIERSIAPNTNPATVTDTYLANAGPYFLPNTYGVQNAIYGGHMYDHIMTGIDQEACQYDAHILVNFHAYFSSVNSSFVAINYWDDFQNTTATCRFDLYTVLLHEVTHAMGWFSAVEENQTTHAAQCGNPGNSFSVYDNLFLYYGTPANTSGFIKVMQSLGINAAVNANTDPLRTNMIWLTNDPEPLNQPVYSGVLDMTYGLMTGSLMSHLNANILSFTGMSQVSPGFQPHYVMGPGVSLSERKREWTLQEFRTLMAMGYQLEPLSFATSTSLNGIDQNQWLLTSNTPAYRTNPGVPILAYNGPFNFMELLPPDQTMTNANVPNQAPVSSWTFNVGSLANVFDNESDLIRVMPNTLFGIRGVSDGGNNHNCVVVNGTGDQVTYTPMPGFHGRAQFGFYFWDGHERGALRIVTIDITPNANYTVTPGNQLVVYPDLEDGTEVRQRILSPNTENTSITNWQYESVFAGQNFSGAHPFNYFTNWFNIAGGDVVENPWYACFMGTIPQDGYYGSASSDWNLQNFGGFQYPIPVATQGTDQRYHHFLGEYNYSTLVNPVQACNVYRFECDLNFEKTNFQVGQTFQFQLQFTNNPLPGLHTQLFYTAPVQVTITTVAPDTWQHVVFSFQYCGSPTWYMNLLVQGIVTPQVVVTGTGNAIGGSPLTNTFTPAFYGVTTCPFIDNISLTQVSPTPPPVTLNVSVNPANVCNGGTTQLSAVPTPYLPCNATFIWQPGNLTGNSVTSGPITSVTTFTATINYACSQSATGTVTVTPSAIPVITQLGPYCSNDNVLHQLTATPGTGVFTGPGVTTTAGNYYFTPSTAGAGIHTITYTYIPFAGCTTIVTSNIVVTQSFTITFGNNGPYCVSQPAQPLFAQPTGGVWSGTGINSNQQFEPQTTGTGTFTLTYTVTNAGCTLSATTTVVVTPAPTVTITPIGPFCVYDPAQTLTVSQGTGTFSGPGVSGNQFNPFVAGIGTWTINWTGTVGACPATAITTVVVNPGTGPGSWPKFVNGNNSRSTTYGVISDQQGNVYITGYFSLTNSNFPTYGVIPAVGQKDLFVIKYNEQCGSVWMRTVNLPGATVIGYDITLDNSGNVYVTGLFQGNNIAFGNNYFLTATSGSEAFLLKLNAATGNTVWAKQSTSPVATSPSNAAGKSVIYSSVTNMVYVEGEFSNTVKFGSLANLVTTGGLDVFVAKYSTAGVESWSTRIGSSASNDPDMAGSLGVDNSGNLYVGCSIAGALSAPVSIANTTGSYNALIVKYNSANAYIASNMLGGGSGVNDDVFLNDMVVDNTGRCYFTGSLVGSVTLNTAVTATTNAVYTAWVSSTLSYTGTWSVVSAASTGADDVGRSIAKDGTYLYVAGTANGTSTFTGFTPAGLTTTAISKEIFVCRINMSTGAPGFLEFSTSSPNGSNQGYCVTVNANNGSVFTGGYLGIGVAATTVNFNTALVPQGGLHAVVARSNASGFFRLPGHDESADETNMTNDSTATLSIVPNPNSGEFTIHSSGIIAENAELIVYDVFGKRIEQTAYAKTSEHTMTVNLGDQPNGFYLVYLVSGNETQVLKTVIHR